MCKISAPKFMTWRQLQFRENLGKTDEKKSNRKNSTTGEVVGHISRHAGGEFR